MPLIKRQSLQRRHDGAVVEGKDHLTVLVHAVTRETDTIRTLDLRPCSSAELLPAFTPGAHVIAHLGNGLSRSYSLANCASERHRYQISIDLTAQSRGGSRWIHQNVRQGDRLRISPPRNNFSLVEDASHTVLIAGGIGITPLLSMLKHLERNGRTWNLLYSVRNRQRAAFLDEVSRSYTHGHAAIHFSDLEGLPDLSVLVRGWPQGTHFYCCGPSGMLESFLRTTREVDPRYVHFERFGSSQQPAEGGFELILAKSQRTLHVQQGESILDRLLAAGIYVPSSCKEGVCGSCEVPLLRGQADHRDAIQTQEEKAANKTIFVCCSGSVTPSLTLDV